MKSLFKAVAIAALLAAPVVSFAQSGDQPVTRAQVRSELIQLEHAGYNPVTSNDSNYPQGVQAAEQRVQAQNPALAQTQTQPVADTSGYGAPASGSSQSGAALQTTGGPHGIYFGN
ncbi:DUF4148 domain-containing protein [Paraburkholderia sp. Ac-20342]|uniref:DUF4148 domain-containing protein n=1 Tax=Paraburkholderia sp. Ac-20342 TaxID=2703889 RepID=UPI001980B5EE|nr:DUF4148 domain-containing protein [Paraburkholderia sp. Ac-20342]MBN3845826.1 DUF4148 domain-containing protein [Paraburkholderia sp. Ac-20342]